MNQPEPTPAFEREIAAFIRAGGFPDVAAAAAGLSPKRLRRWLRVGRCNDANANVRSFALAIFQSRGQGRLQAEIAVHDAMPLDWLRYGPGKGTTRRPGWTNAIRIVPLTSSSDLSPLAGPTWQALLEQVLPEIERLTGDRENIADFISKLKIVNHCR
jgi:hypothetical protein